MGTTTLVWPGKNRTSWEALSTPGQQKSRIFVRSSKVRKPMPNDGASSPNT
jgi:hypothetical protein